MLNSPVKTSGKLIGFDHWHRYAPVTALQDIKSIMSVYDPAGIANEAQKPPLLYYKGPDYTNLVKC